MDSTENTRRQVIQQLQGGQAYETFEEILGSVPTELRGVVPSGAGHSAWRILEHMRISQRDILDFTRNEKGDYVERKWPDDYWPAETAPPKSDSWDKSVESYRNDRAELEKLVGDPKSDLHAPFPWSDDGQTLLREALLACDHSSYHLGQIVVVQRLLENEKK